MVITRTRTTEWATWVWLLVGILAAILVLALTSMTAGTVLPDKEPPPVVPVLCSWDGVFYAGRHFGDEPFVRVGSEVDPDTVVATIEGMRRFQQTAGMKGTIVEVLVEDSAPVQRGTHLFMLRLDPPLPPH